MANFKSLRWDVFYIRESDIKSYKGIQLNKTRPIMVISTNKLLLDRALIVELGSNKINENSIYFYSYTDKLGNRKDSYIFPDRIHTVYKYYLHDRNKLKNQKVPQSVRESILNFVKKVFKEE